MCPVACARCRAGTWHRSIRVVAGSLTDAGSHVHITEFSLVGSVLVTLAGMVVDLPANFLLGLVEASAAETTQPAAIAVASFSLELSECACSDGSAQT